MPLAARQLLRAAGATLNSAVMSALLPSSSSLAPSSLSRMLDEFLAVLAPAGVRERTLHVLRAGSIRQESTAASGPKMGSLRASSRHLADMSDTAKPRGAGPEASSTPEASISMEQLVREHADAVYRVALSVTRDPALAEDASQDTLIKAWQSLPSFRAEAPLRHWILRIAHNVSISLLRQRREEIIAPFDMPEQATPQGAVEHQVQERVAIDRFEDALSQLDGISRSIVVLREIEGLSYAEMSDVLELPLPTIRTRLLRARRQLASALEGWQP